MSEPAAKAASPPDALDLLGAWPEPAWLVVGTPLQVLAANPAAGQWLNRPVDQLRGLAAEAVLPSLEDAAFWAGVQAGEASALDSEVSLPHPDGARTVHRRITPLPAVHGQAVRWLVSLRDLSRERAEIGRAHV